MFIRTSVLLRTKVTVPGGQAGTQEEVISKAKQSRSEKKARKALSKLGLQQLLALVTFCRID